MVVACRDSRFTCRQSYDHLEAFCDKTNILVVFCSPSAIGVYVLSIHKNLVMTGKYTQPLYKSVERHLADGWPA